MQVGLVAQLEGRLSTVEGPGGMYYKKLGQSSPLDRLRWLLARQGGQRHFVS